MSGSWGAAVLNVVTKVFSPLIRKKLENRFKGFVEKKLVNSLNVALNELVNTSSVTFGKTTLPVEFYLESAPSFKEDRVEFLFNAFVYDPKKGKTPCCEPDTLPEPVVGDPR